MLQTCECDFNESIKRVYFYPDLATLTTSNKTHSVNLTNGFCKFAIIQISVFS